MGINASVASVFQQKGQEAAIEQAILNICADIKDCHLRFSNLEQLSERGRAYALALMNCEETLEGAVFDRMHAKRPKEG